jgi:hypothetical protein
MGEDLVLQFLGVEVVLAQEGIDGRLLVEVDDGAGSVFVGDAELLAGVGGARRFQDVDTEEEVCFAVGDGAGRGVEGLRD